MKVSREEWLEKYKKLQEWRARQRPTPTNSGPSLGAITYKKIIDEINIPEGSKVLDVGCGSMGLKPLLPSGVKYYGVDPFPIAPPQTWEEMGFYQAEAEDIPFLNHSFDYVFCFASIFHFRELDKAFKEMARVLKVGGELFILTVMNGTLSSSHTFLISSALLKTLTNMTPGLKFIFSVEVPEIKSWLWRWRKVEL